MKFLKANPKAKILLFLLIIISIYFFSTKFYENQSTSINNNTSRNSYASKLWSRVSQGDVSSTSCQKAIEKYSQYKEFYDSFYSYKKKRCFGINSYTNTNGGVQEAETIYDLITGDKLVSCTYVSDSVGSSVECIDSQKSWSFHDGDKLPYPDPWPIYIKTWKELKSLGAE